MSLSGALVSLKYIKTGRHRLHDASLQKVYVSDQMISDISLCFLISLPFKIYFRNKTVT